MAASPDWIRTKDVPRIPRRNRSSHKGHFGRILVVAGSLGMSGAAVLAGTSALRGGAGLVTVACPADALPMVASGFPCYTTLGLPSESGHLAVEAEAYLAPRLADFNVIAAGPGLGRSPGVIKMMDTLLRAEVPLVLDADALNAISQWPLARNAPTVVTPHPGEFSRMTGYPVPQIQVDREHLAVNWARANASVLLLKGSGTIVTDGLTIYTNSTGNPGMATGGSGDVLTGIVAALIGQGLSPLEATILAAWVHGRAGDLAAERLGEISLTARDLLDFLPGAFGEVVG